MLNEVTSAKTIDKQAISSRVGVMIIGLLLLGYCLLTILPWDVIAYGFDLDESWASAVQVAFRDGIQFGTDFVYTYGPYGFLRVARYYFPETFGFGFGFSIFIAIAVWVGLFRIVRYCLSRRDGSVWFLLPVLGFFPNMILSMDSFQFPIIFLPLLLYFYVSKRMSPALVLTIVNAALASLTKHTYLVLCIFFVILITIDEIGRLKRIPQVASIYLAFIWLFWILAAQDLANFPAYLINGLQISKGFSAALGIAGNFNELILYVLSTGLFVLLVSIIEWQNRRWWGALPVLGLAAILFISFKGAFVRHDTHALQGLFNVAPILMIYTALIWSPIAQNTWRITKKIRLAMVLLLGTSLLSFVIMGSMMLHHHFDLSYGNYSLQVVEHNTRMLDKAVKAVSGQGNFQAIADAGKLNVRNQNPLPAGITGTVDLYPNELATIFAHDLEYQPRPVIQSFAAYTSKLAQMNLEHLKTSDAAQNILFDLKPIDGHLASFEDGLSWPEILTLYDITNIDSRYLLLQRNAQPRNYQLEPLSEEVNVGFNQWFEVESTQPVWAKIDLHPNILGKLATTALRLPPLYIEIETADGIQTRYRTIGDIMSEGFLLSPVLDSRWDFLDFATNDWQDKLSSKQVTRFRIVNEGNNAKLYPASYQVSLTQLKFPRQSFAQVPSWEDWNSQLIPKPLNGGLQRLEEIDGEDRTGWMAHAPMRMLVDIKANSQSFNFSYGILEEGVKKALEENAGDGVEFKIIAMQTNNQEKVLFDRRLQPRLNPEDRGIHQASIDLSQINSSKLILETIVGEDNKWDWSYWSELKVN